MDPISPKVELVVITRTGDGDDAVATKVWCVEVRVVGDVKDLRAELESCTFFDREILEDREVHPVEAGARDLGHATEGADAGYRNAARRRIRDDRNSIVVQYAGLGERRRVPEPTELVRLTSVWRPNLSGAP